MWDMYSCRGRGSLGLVSFGILVVSDGKQGNCTYLQDCMYDVSEGGDEGESGGGGGSSIRTAAS